MKIFKEFLTRTGIGVRAYIKSSLVTSLVCFFILLLGLYIGKVPYFGLLALIIAIADLLPLIGSGLILIPCAIISLVAGDRRLALILMICYVLSFLIEQILQPILLGRSIGIKPLYTLLITIISMVVFSPAMGAIIGAILSIVIGVAIDMKNQPSRR